METFLKIHLPLFFVTFIILVFVVPSVRVYRQTGINPFRFTTNHNSAHDYIGASMKVFILLLLIVVLAHSLLPSVYAYFAPIEYLQTNVIKHAGFALVHISLIGIMTAQHQMKQSWRIGIDYENKTKLITHGLFSFSRNPIFLFLLIGLVGMFLLLPNALSFAVLFAAYLVLQVTMRLEEEFLLTQHGTLYAAYKSKVRRLL